MSDSLWDDIRAAVDKARNAPYLPLYTYIIPHWADELRNRTMNETYVALYPHSNTNPTAKYRVVLKAEWDKVLDGEETTYRYSEFDTFDEAINARDRLNSPKKKKEDSGTVSGNDKATKESEA